MKVTLPHIIRSSVIGTIVILALLFIPAGTLTYWQGWAYVATFIVCSLAYTVYLAKHDPALLRRRIEAGISHEKEPAQKVIMFFLYVSFGALIIVPPLDFRFGWSNVPWYVSIFGDALVAVSFYIFYLVSKVNTYAAANVRVEEGQKVISTGIYGLIRHPMYSGALFLIVGTPLALASWWALLLIPLFTLVLYFRIVNEEKVLLRDLQGYADYCAKVRWHLIPGIF
ncbi:MAG TPA: isoprenylcysteine carboxylmethyltransferase family protein [Syntrophorhabdales bacterium]|nr:isoprenylcysteine carboxylmethyltransferase family protein [Syntrophorhabdales bacterium]